MTRKPLDLPDDAVPVTTGTDPIADLNWLNGFEHTDRHYRFYETFERQFPVAHPNNEILFGVVLIDGTDIESSQSGTLFPSPSMIGHLDSLPGMTSNRDEENPLRSYKQHGGTYDAARFDSDTRFRIDVSTIDQNRISWRLVRRVAATARCPKCNKLLRTAAAEQCFACGADWH